MPSKSRPPKNKSALSRLPMRVAATGAGGVLPRQEARTIFLLSKDAKGYKVCRDAGRLRRTSGQTGGREEDHSGESSSSRKETQQPVTKGSHQRTPFLCCYRELWEMISCAKGWGRRGCGFLP